MTQRVRPDVLAVIALGGIVGATARYGLARALPTSPGRFPWATFWTNMSGSLVLGFLVVVLLDRARSHRLLRPFLATGILGAYTTMSTYLVETAVLIKDGHATVGVAYALASVVVGLLLAFAGMVGARQLRQRP
jgi:CrcB protein